MTTRFAAFMAFMALAAMVIAGGARQHPAGSPGAPAVTFALADRFDVSPALRHVPPRPPQSRAMHEMGKFRRFTGPRSRDAVVQNTPVTPQVPLPSMTVEGVGNVNGVLPPDTNGDVGPHHFVQWVNLSFAVYAKGAPSTPPTLLYGPADGNTLWTGFGGACESTNNGDPVVRYDHIADRWVMSQLALPNSFVGILFPPFYQCIAVSVTPDPLGPYYRYQYSFNKLNDYPKFGVWPDGYYMTMNQFTAPALQFAGQGVVAFDRASMLAGQPAGMVYVDLAPVDLNLGGMLPSDLDGPPPPAGAPNVFMQVDDDAWGYAPDQLQLWSFHADWANPSASSFTHTASLPTAPFDSNLCNHAENCIPQPGTATRVDPLADRLMYRLQYRNFGSHESLVVNHTVDVDGGDHAGIRWYEVRDPQGAPAIYQQGTYAPDGDHRWMGSAAMDSAGNLAIGFSVSGPFTFPSIRYAARLADDPVGLLAQGETSLIAGSGSQTNSSGRWGDYSMLTVDPADDCTFWYTQEYYGSTSDAGWQTRIGTFALPGCTPPSPTGPAVTVTATTPVATEAGPASGQFTIARTGDTSAPLTVPYTTGGTAASGADYVPLPGTATIPAGSASVAVAVTPIDDPSIEPNETVILSISPDAAYTVASPGTALVTIVSDDLPPDLVLTALTAPTIGGADAAITVTDTTKNQSGGPSDPSTTGFYLSKDFVLSADDPQIGSRPVPALAVGASDSASTSVTIPAGTAPGLYMVIAKADAPNAEPETQENNNTKWLTITIGPDLYVSPVTAPASAAAGGTIGVTDTTLNRGGGAAGASTTAFYLSTNFLLDGSDVPLGSRPVPALASGGSNLATTTLTIPAGTPSGTYYVVALADSANAVAESAESNNAAFSTAIRIGGDLVVGSVTVPAVAGAGGTIVVNDTTVDQGAGAVAASTTAFYLSANFGLDAGDTFLGSRPVPALATGGSSAGSTSLTIPAGTPTGNYYIAANADDSGSVAESIETNNVRFSALIRVGPDLTESSVTAPTAAGAGATITVGDTARNQGGGAAGPSTTTLYISTSAIFSAAAVPIGSHATPALAPGAASAASTLVTLPSTLATGNYYVMAAADTAGGVAETIETNNASLGALVRIGPDLTESALTVPGSAVAGAAIQVSDTVLNLGGGSATPSTTRFYLSTNFVFDAADVPLGVRAVGAIAAGQSSAGTTSLVIPAGTPAGNYYVLAVADGDGAVPETSETNNTRGAFIRISGS